MRENKIGSTWHAFIKYIPIFLLKSKAQNYQLTSLRKGMGRGSPNNFAQVTTILGNQY